MTQTDLFRRIAAVLMQAGISSMITGSFASTVYGMARSSPDLDFIIAAGEEQIRSLFDLFPENDFYSDLEEALESCQRKSMFHAIDKITGLKIDFIFLQDQSFRREAFGRRREALIEDMHLCIEAPEDIVLAKLEHAKNCASLRQMEDVVGILKVRNDLLDRPYIEKWVPELGLNSEWDKARQLAGLE